MTEEWRDVVGYEGLYEVSNTGKVRSVNFYGKCGYSKELRVSVQNNGYLLTHLSKNGVSKGKLVHRLVAMAFIPNPDNLEMVNHKDENKTNNNVDNLEWCTRSYNLKYTLNRHDDLMNKYKNNFKDKETGDSISPFTKRGVPHKYKQRVVQKTKDGEIIGYYSCPAEASMANGVDSGNVISVCKRNAKIDRKRKEKASCNGYVFEFV